MILGKVAIRQNTKVKIFNILFIRDCKAYVQNYFRSKKHQDDVMRLKYIEEYLHSMYNVNGDIKAVILSILSCVNISETGVLSLNAARVADTPVDVLYRIITEGTLTFRGVNVLTRAITYASLRDHWRIK